MLDRVSSSWTRSAPAVVHKDVGGVALSTPHGIVSLSPVEARQLALDLTMASGLAKPRPGRTWFGVVLAGLWPLTFSRSGRSERGRPEQSPTPPTRWRKKQK